MYFCIVIHNILCSCIYVDTFLGLRGDIIANHGYVMIGDIGFTDDKALLCYTNRPPLSNGTDSGGDWFAPDGTRVADTDVPGVTRNRGPMVVRLLRDAESGTPPEGIYHCVIEDDTLTQQVLYVGIYNNGGGIVYVCSH